MRSQKYLIFIALFVLFFSCGTHSNHERPLDGHMVFLSLEIESEGTWSELKPYDNSPTLEIDENGIATVIMRRAEGCSLTREDFNGFARLTKDTVYLFADYNWVGPGQKIGTMDACINKYTFKVANYPKELPFKVVFD